MLTFATVRLLNLLNTPYLLLSIEGARMKFPLNNLLGLVDLMLP